MKILFIFFLQLSKYFDQMTKFLIWEFIFVKIGIYFGLRFLNYLIGIKEMFHFFLNIFISFVLSCLQTHFIHFLV